MRAAEARAGFTLLEVMAAVAILGLVYTVLGGAGIQGLQHEGEARRRIAASLLADQVLQEIESQLEAGTAPPPGEEESEAGDYAITVAVAPLDLVVPEDERPPEGLEGPGSRDRRPGESRREGAELGTSFLVGSAGRPSPLRRIDVQVRWIEGFGERSVVRTTFGLDPEAVRESLQALDSAAETAATGAPPAAGASPAASRGSGLGGRRGDGGDR